MMSQLVDEAVRSTKSRPGASKPLVCPFSYANVLLLFMEFVEPSEQNQDPVNPIAGTQ